MKQIVWSKTPLNDQLILYWLHIPPSCKAGYMYTTFVSKIPNIHLSLCCLFFRLILRSHPFSVSPVRPHGLLRAGCQNRQPATFHNLLESISAAFSLACQDCGKFNRKTPSPYLQVTLHPYLELFEFPVWRLQLPNLCWPKILSSGHISPKH